MEAVAAADEVAAELVLCAVLLEADPWPRPVQIVEADRTDLETDLAAGGEPGRDQVSHDLVLAVDGDRAPAAEAGEVDAMAAAGEAQLEPLVDQAFLLQARADACLLEQVGRALLEHAGADPLLDVRAAVALEHDRSDAFEMQKVRQQEAGRTGADDANLGLHGLASPVSCGHPDPATAGARRQPALALRRAGLWSDAQGGLFWPGEQRRQRCCR